MAGSDALGADRRRIEKTCSNLEQRGINVMFVEDRRAALSTVLDMIPKGSSVAHGSSTTLKEIGFTDRLKSPGSEYRYMNSEWMAESDAVKRGRLRARLSLEADYYLGSVQAICETGEVLAVDASGSRVAFYTYGPPHVIWVAGVNKLVASLEEGLRRLREVALPLEDKRLRDAGGSGSRLGKTVIIEWEKPGRITLVLVGESLGL